MAIPNSGCEVALPSCEGDAARIGSNDAGAQLLEGSHQLGQHLLHEAPHSLAQRGGVQGAVRAAQPSPQVQQQGISQPGIRIQTWIAKFLVPSQSQQQRMSKVAVDRHAVSH